MKELRNIIKDLNPLVQFGDSITPETVEAGFNFIDNGIEEKNIYYYHPDHLGSSSHITDVNGDLSQHTEYMVFGEILFDEHSTSIIQPYLFNGKELDSDTGLYYYGARYYDPKVSIFINVDPLAEKYPETSAYTYTLNNPIKFIDPDGRDIVPYFVNRIRYKNDEPSNFNRDGYNFKLYTTKGYFSKPMDAAMKKIAGSETGKKFLLQYMKKGQSFYGIKATEDGKLSDKNLNIYDIRNNNKVDRNYEWVMGYDSQIANGKTAFDESSGDLNIYIGTAKIGLDRVDSLVETTAHELGKHGTKHERYLNLLNSGKTEQLGKEQKIDFNNDHYESKNPKGAKVYNGIMNDLNMKTEWAKEKN